MWPNSFGHFYPKGITMTEHQNSLSDDAVLITAAGLLIDEDNDYHIGNISSKCGIEDHQICVINQIINQSKRKTIDKSHPNMEIMRLTSQYPSLQHTLANFAPSNGSNIQIASRSFSRNSTYSRKPPAHVIEKLRLILLKCIEEDVKVE